MPCGLLTIAGVLTVAGLGPAKGEPPVNQWVLHPVQAPNIVWETGIAYDPDTRLIVRHGGHILGSYCQDNYVDLFDLRADRFTLSKAPSRPQRRCLVDVTYIDSARRVLTVNGGSSHGSLPQGGPNADYTRIVQSDPRGPWLYDVKTDTWEDCRTLPPVWKRAAHSPIAYDPVSDTLFGVSGNVLNLFQVRANRVAHKPLPAAMGSRVGHSLGVDPVNRKLVLFGGSKDGGWVWAKGDRAEAYKTMVMNDTWVYDIVKGEWREARPKTVPPRGAPISDHITAPMVFHPPSGTILMLQQPLDTWEPDNTKWPPADLWSFDGQAEEWTKAALANDKDRPFYPGHLTYASHEDVLVLWGGGRDGVVGENRFRPALSRQIRTIRVRIPGRQAVDVAALVPAPTQPWRPSGLVASVESAKKVALRWNANAEKDVVGYKVYRAKGKEIEDGKGTCLTPKPIAETRYIDADLDLSDTVMRVYCVTAVNKGGIESGASPLAYTAPDAVTHLDAAITDNADGSRTITLTWQWPDDLQLAGFNVYHATRHVNSTGSEEFRKLWTKLTEAPTPERRFVLQVPKGGPDLHLFYVRAVNVLGQEGFHTDIVSPTDKRFRP